jgi:hypothetical protein
MKKGVPVGTASDRGMEEEGKTKTKASPTTKPVNSGPKPLKLRAHNQEQRAQTRADGIEVLTGEALKEKRIQKQRADKKATRKRKEASIIEWVSLILVTGPGLYFLWMQGNSFNDAWMKHYTEYRLPVILVAWILVIILAFKTTRLSGFLAFLLPPYWAFFLLTEVDQKLIRGVVTGLLILVMMELVFIPKHAFLAHAQKDFNQIVVKAQRGITSDANYDVR